MVRRSFRPLLAFAAVIAAAGTVTAAGLSFTAHTVSQSVAELPEVKARVLPSYVVHLPVAKASDLDISKTVAVKPQIKVPGEAPAATIPAPDATTLVAEVAPPATEPATAGIPYLVSSDVFVRSGPSKSFDRLGTVTAGTEVRVSDEKSGWMKVSFDGGSGWVYQRYLTSAQIDEVAEADTGSAPF